MKNKRLTKEQKEILNRCKITFKNWVTASFEQDCKRILIANGIKEKHGNFTDAYPIVGAVLLDNCVQMLNGSSYARTVKQQKREAHKYMMFNVKMI